MDAKNWICLSLVCVTSVKHFVTPYTFPWAGVIYFPSRAVFDAKSIIKKLFIIMHV